MRNCEREQISDLSTCAELFTHGIALRSHTVERGRSASILVEAHERLLSRIVVVVAAEVLLIPAVGVG